MDELDRAIEDLTVAIEMGTKDALAAMAYYNRGLAYR